MDKLGKLLGNINRVRAIKLFLFNSEVAFSTREAARRLKISPATMRREIRSLKDLHFIRDKRGGRQLYILNSDFNFLPQLRTLFNIEVFSNRDQIVKRFKKCGPIKSLIISGIFLENNPSRVDLVVVGDRLKKVSIEQVVRSMEAEIGKELTYAVLPTNDFLYRLHSGDKFVRDVLDYEHQKLVDRLVF